MRAGVISICRLETAASRDDFQHLGNMQHGLLGEHPVGQALVLQQPHARGGLFDVLPQVTAPLPLQRGDRRVAPRRFVSARDSDSQMLTRFRDTGRPAEVPVA